MSIHIFVVDGPDGVGKTTLIHELVNYFNYNTSYKAYTFSPSNNVYGKKIKQLIKDLPDLPLEVERQLHLTTLQYLVEEIRPLVRESVESETSTIIFLDRWDVSTGIYQLYARVPNVQPWLNDAKIKGIVINQYFILDADDALLDKRIEARREKEGYEQGEFQRRVRQGYRELFDYHLSKFTRIVLGDDLEENKKTLLTQIIHRLNGL